MRFDNALCNRRKAQSYNSLKKCEPPNKPDNDCPVCNPLIVCEYVCNSDDHREVTSQKDHRVICDHLDKKRNVFTLDQKDGSQYHKNQSPKLRKKLSMLHTKS